MKVLGICGSPRKENTSGNYKLVKTVLESTGLDYELVSLRGKKIDGCIACLGCAKDNICKVKDDMADLREKIVEADAYVIGSPNYYSTVNAKTHAFLERLYQFRHQEDNSLWGKLGVAVGVGGTAGHFPADAIESFYDYNSIDTVAKVIGKGAPSCYSCGYGETCRVGIPIILHGEGVKITPETTPDVTKDADLMKVAEKAGKALTERLTNDHDRKKVTATVQARMMEKMQHSA